jgi:hypothetical protein
MTGQNGGSSCGTTTDLDVTIGGGDIFGIGGSTTHKHMGKMSNCNPESGDSGGPIFRFHVAYGIYTGSRGDCEQYFQGARRAQDSLNVNIVTRK